MSKALPTVLTIAGSDSGGGAGIQADLKTFTMLGTYGTSVLTALTAQNSIGVQGIFAPEASFVAQQMESVTSDMEVKAAKTGMLFSVEIIEALAPFFEKATYPLVVDPVCVATSGDRLLKSDAVDALKTLVIPYADLITPNRQEAELLAGVKINSRRDCFTAIERLLALGPKAVLIKGGHFDEFAAITDWLGVAGKEPLPFIQPRVETNNTHGTGCTLSAAIAATLAKGEPLMSAVREAQQFLNLGLRASFAPGNGPGPVNHVARLQQESARHKVLEETLRAGRAFAAMDGAASLMPETGFNLAVGLPFADSPEAFASFDGPMVQTMGGHVLMPGCPRYGACEYLGKVLVGVRTAGSNVHVGAMVRQSQCVEDAAQKADLSILKVDRDREDEDNVLEGVTLDWHVLLTLRENEGHVDILVDERDGNHESVCIVLAESAEQLLEKLHALSVKI